MTLKEAIEYFGTRSELAKKLNISLPAISFWKNKIPMGRQYQIELMTNGELKADTESEDSERQVA